MRLERAKRSALQHLPDNTRNGVVLCETSEIALGIGYGVAKGWITYHGGGEFRITEAGRAARDNIWTE